MEELEIPDFIDFDNDNVIQIGITLLDNENKKDFDEYAKEILKRAGWKAEANADDGESKSHDISGRNSHNIFDLDER